VRVGSSSELLAQHLHVVERLLLARRETHKVDLVVVRGSDQRRMLLTAKWSIRADREKQFPAEFTSCIDQGWIVGLDDLLKSVIAEPRANTGAPLGARPRAESMSSSGNGISET
jgi:hypothetical protein